MNRWSAPCVYVVCQCSKRGGDAGCGGGAGVCQASAAGGSEGESQRLKLAQQCWWHGVHTGLHKVAEIAVLLLLPHSPAQTPQHHRQEGQHQPRRSSTGQRRCAHVVDCCCQQPCHWAASILPAAAAAAATGTAEEPAPAGFGVDVGLTSTLAWQRQCNQT